jgi:hypothetical protein
MNLWQAFQTGLGRTGRYWQLWLILYVFNLLGALVLALLPALSLVSGPGHRPAIRQAADGLDAWMVIETLMSPSTMAALDQGATENVLTPGLQQALLVGAITLLALPWLAWLPSALMSGGLLLIYSEAPQPFRSRRFLWGCWHWFGSFLLLGLVQAFGLILALLPTLLLLMPAARVGRWLAWLIVAGLVLWIALWLVLLEYSRIEAVVGRTRNSARAFGRAVRFVFRHPLPVAGLYLLTLVLAGMLHALFRLGLLPSLPLNQWLLVFLVQQIFMLARLVLRLVRLAGGTALVAAAGAAEVDPALVGGTAVEIS